ncbi:hypothetical protein GWI33_023184 [Rhynchophorus ferrugineus]|uniref:Uncharacterized protein n=1 Tax=Rhynchophorus ferrugineus TaxID=354439 RepID=A0A834ITQ9_RHYFE|nr:hypothetical protein GWI33_023184 [Rhynchophorus ferrugineus]
MHYYFTIFVYFCIIGRSLTSGLNKSVIINLNFLTNYENVVNNSIEFILVYGTNNVKQIPGPPRVSITSKNATNKDPLMVVSRQPKELLSWKLPLVVESENGEQHYMNTSRTLCYDILKHKKLNEEVKHENPIVSISSSSEQNIHFNVLVDFPEFFHLEHSIDYNVTISPNKPQYFFYNFSSNDNASTNTGNSNFDTVILEAVSSNEACAIVSIQNVSCPVFDLNQDITFRGFYETFSLKAGMTIPKYKFPYGFYIVFVVKPDDYECTKSMQFFLSQNREKKILLTIKPSITYNDYIYAVILTLSAIGAFYITFGLAFFFCSRRYYVPREMQYAEQDNPAASVNTRVATVTPDVSNNLHAGISSIIENESIDETDYDHVIEIQTDSTTRRCRSQPFLIDLARKPPKVLVKKSYLYLYNVLTVALFYALPVIQLVVTYQRVLNETGEQDLCYYNFLCAHPLGLISDFNHVFSNVGYILFGILFLIITKHREMSHQDKDFDRQYGIPQHYGLFYAMGVALIMEGILSGSYHVCPSQLNFQFDTSFMYVMAVLCMVKLYQNRHPDINASAYTTFGFLAVAILLCIIGILENTEGFWIFFIILHIITIFYLSIKMYYMGCWNLDVASLQRFGHIVRSDFWSGPLNVLKPCYRTRFIMITLGNVFNWILAGYALYYHPKNFGVFLLLIFMSNTMFYFLFYIIMKYIHKERVKFLTWIFLVISLLCAVSAMYFFLHKATSWSKTPAQSRVFNMECKLLHFYDFHDIWHFLSAIGMFFMFMVLLTLDDDLSHKHHTCIPVF